MKRYLPVIILLLSALTMSCSRKTYIPQTQVNTRDSVIYRYKDSTVIHHRVVTRDTLIIHDSIIYVVDEDGEILRKERYRDRERISTLQSENDRLREALEKASSHKTDSVFVPVPYEREPGILERWTKNITMAISLAAILYIGIKLISWLLHKKK